MTTYDPGRLYPGGTEPRPQYIGRPAPTYTAGPLVNQIEQRWRSIRSAYSSVMLGQDLTDFLEGDVSRLIAIARAASAWSRATNAESYRQAAQTLQAVLRQTF